MRLRCGLHLRGLIFFWPGDIACWPDPHSGQPVRIEHWVVAERQGQVAARNILGRERFETVPFFWTRQFAVSINYIGATEKWDAVEIDGRLEGKNWAVKYKLAGRVVAVATTGRDLQSLQTETTMDGGSNGFSVAAVDQRRGGSNIAP